MSIILIEIKYIKKKKMFFINWKQKNNNFIKTYFQRNYSFGGKFICNIEEKHFFKKKKDNLINEQRIEKVKIIQKNCLEYEKILEDAWNKGEKFIYLRKFLF